MKKLTIIITLFFLFLNCSFAADVKTVTKDYKIVTNDGFTISAKLEYPKIKEKNDFSTVVLLHSLGYSSEWWDSLPDYILNSGHAVLFIDLRGHGNSVYNSKLVRVSWKSLTKKAFEKYPSDVYSVIEYVKSQNKRTFFNNWVIVGSDIGASTAIISANMIPYKPKTIVLLSPVVNSKGLYVPVKLAELNNIDILSVIGTNDDESSKANSYLKRFAQSTFAEYVSESNSNGMMMLKNDTMLSKIINSWINEYLK